MLDVLHLPHTLGALVLFFSACMLVRAAISQQTSRFIGLMVAEIASELRNEVLDRLLQARWSYFTVNPVGRFISAVSDRGDLGRLCLSHLADRSRGLDPGRSSTVRSAC